LKTGFALGGRLVLLLPMAFCIFLLLDSQDKTVRLLAIIALVVLEQAREWMLVKNISELRDSNKKGAK